MQPSATVHPCPAAPTREALLDLAAGAPWGFLDPAHAYLDQHPEDHEIRLLAAAHLVELRLRALALEHLEQLPDDIASTDDARCILDAATTLRSDLVSLDARVSMCRRNLAALDGKHPELTQRFETWVAERASRVRVHRAKDGNAVAVRLADGATPPTRFIDHKSVAARTVIAVHDTDRPPLLVRAPSPWLLERALRAQKPGDDGRHPPVLILTDSPLDLLDALATLDLTSLLRDARMHLFAEDDGVDRLRARLIERESDRLPDIVRTPTKTPVPDAIHELIEEVAATRRSTFAEIERQVETLYGARDRLWWNSRFENAQRGGPPLRVLLLTSRFSTFIKHSIDDIAASLRDAGHATRLLAEPDDEAALTSLASMRAIEDFEPDLVLAINYPRASLSGLIHRQVPFVCWIQDAMPHLFSAQLGAAQGDLDFVVGHLHPSLFRDFGYPTNRAIRTPVLASTRKFHPAPVTESLRSRYACDLAYMGHQSETVDAQRARFLAQEPPGPVRRAIEHVAGNVAQVIDAALDTSLYAATRSLATEALRTAAGSEPSAGAIAAFHSRYTAPMVDRAFRHQTLDWATQIATSNSLEFRIYGRGWDTHPALREFARPAVEHGEDLRACYQSARAHLHVSISTLSHQRVLECALSGGFPLCRLHLDEIWAYTLWCAQECARLILPANPAPEADSLLYPVAGHDFLERLMALREAVHIAPSTEFVVDRSLRDWAEQLPPLKQEQQAAHFLGDLPSRTFQSFETLDRLLEQVMRDQTWRDDASRGIRDRIRGNLTYESCIPAMLAQITAMLGDPVPR